MGMYSFAFELLKELLGAWQSGGRKTRAAIVVSVLLVVLGVVIAFVGDVAFGGGRMAIITRDLGGAIAIFGFAVSLVIYGLQRGKEEVIRERKIEAVEKRVQENPKETQAAWELARVKLESYLSRNLSQVKSIFWLTVLVMTGGFGLIGTGAYEAFRDPVNFRASVLTTVSGVVVSFIGGTFLVLYKATMAQAKDYVTILERINAVGMSVQILDSIDAQNSDLKQRTIADIAKQLLLMYTAEAATFKGTSPKSASQSARLD
jgi:hypothetical protein